MKLQNIIETDKQYYMNTFGSRNPVCFEHGKGINLWDTNDKMYYDFFAGIAVSALGHSHPVLVNAIKEQAEKFLHCSNLYYIEPQAKLAKLLVENSCADKVFFSNSGAEANEGAIKLSRIYFKKKGQPEKFEIISLINSFHGRTITTATATGQKKYSDPFAPLTPGFVHVLINDKEAIKNAINKNTCAILLEPIQGESGVYPLTHDYINYVKDLCIEHDLLLIFDEVQTGIGRTGNMFGYQFLGIEPDIFTLAKALGGGVPIGAVCAKSFVAAAFEPGDHGSTFGGNPLACSAGIAVMNTILNENLIENSKQVGEYFKECLTNLSKKFPIISEIRGIGLMIGIELDNGIAKSVKDKLFDKGYLIGNVGEKIIRILPPLILTKQDIDSFIVAFEECLCQ